MSSTESEIESDQSDDDIEEEEMVDDILNDMHDNGDDYHDENGDDDFYDFDDTTYFTSLWDSIIAQTAPSLREVPLVDIPENYVLRLAMHSRPSDSTNFGSSIPLVNDSLKTYLTAPPLIKQLSNTGQHCLAMDLTIDESKSNPLTGPQLYVGNLPYTTKYRELRDWFVQLGHNVSYVELKINKKSVRFAFVRFDSIPTATEVLYKSETRKSNFIFNGHILDIKRPTRSPTKVDLKRVLTALTRTSPITEFKITDAHYGTLITGAAMKNIQRTNSIISNTNGFGIIAHNLINGTYGASFSFNIDTENKKLSIIVRFSTSVLHSFMLDINKALKFEWSFRDLKGRKITPILINHETVFLLVEVKRAPIILETRNVDGPLGEFTDESRLPGNSLIGHANAWIFRINSNNPNNDYYKLFSILRRYNLTQRQFSEQNIVHLLRTLPDAKRNLESVQLVSNDEWIKENKVKVDDFFNRRWPSYPFETKFEIMKLISKHIITLHDLIVDEPAEDILKLCTINTLIALTDKIREFAPRWFATICEDEDEDWDKENEQEQRQETELEQGDDLSTTIEDVPDTDDLSNLDHIRSSATGSLVNTNHAQIVSLTAAMTRHNLRSTKPHLGTFSRLLICALEELLKKYQLYRTKPSKIYVTKLELRTSNVNPYLIRKIYVTPSTVLYEGPYREEKCAVTRHFADYQDRFIRVTFRDEVIFFLYDYRVLRNYNNNMSKMYEHIKKILINGVNVCDRHYQFLAFSSSQLREHSCWMFASIKDMTVDTIREWMGDFRNVHPVAKYAARLGQSFSTTIKGIKLDNAQFREISDYTRPERVGGHDRERCFTDGIGIISATLAKQLAKEMKLGDNNVFPSAFQIRCGGYKGMVCLDVFNCIEQPGVDVYFRRSLNKFAANNFSIDVVRTSFNPSVGFLNRQIILLLSSLGIRNESFISLQDQMLQQLRALTGKAQDACQSLKDLNEFGGNGYHAFLIAYLRRLGEQRDPFVRRLLRAFQAFLVKELRTKAKIRVPNSWCLLGVIDESRTLKYGQVFIQIDNTHQQKEGTIKEIFRGPVVVTRNPCFHPGDIRRLEAVDIPSFHGLKNVIVFPMHGPRPHAMEMSGGDLDGDTFWISRHPGLIFYQNEDPFDYQDQEDGAKVTQAQATVQHTIKDVCNFFGEYIAADNLGLIANSHLAFADRLPGGAKNEKCLRLARMHSVAVDFAKNGESAREFTRDLRPQEYPHYMEKKDKKEYHSETILGILYDKVHSYSSDFYIDQDEEITATSKFPYKIFFLNEIDVYMKDAGVIKNDYDLDLKRIMRQYGIKHEVEVVSGYILKFTSKQYAKETKLFELRNEITHAYRVIQDKYLRLFWQEFYQPTDELQREEDDEIKWSEISKKLTWRNQLDMYEYHLRDPSYEEVKKKASAWFRTTYEPWLTYVKKYQRNKNKNRGTSTNNQQTNEETQYFKGLFSFAWLVYPVLLKIFEEKEGDLKIEIETKKKKRNKRKKQKNQRSVASNNNRH